MELNYGTKSIYINKETAIGLEELMHKTGLSISQVIARAVNELNKKEK